MQKIDPLFQKTRIFRPKIDPFFQDRGHTNFAKKDPFSAKIRTMMRTISQREWRDRAGDIVHPVVCVFSVISVLLINQFGSNTCQMKAKYVSYRVVSCIWSFGIGKYKKDKVHTNSFLPSFL